MSAGVKTGGRAKGTKNKVRNKPGSLVAKKALQDMDNEFIESAYKYLSSEPDKTPIPRTNMEKLFKSVFERACDPEDKTSHQHAKLIFERVIPQRKQVEHLGDADAKRLGVNINVITEKAHERAPIEHESEGRGESHGAEHLRRSLEEQPESVAESRPDPESPKRIVIST